MLSSTPMTMLMDVTKLYTFLCETLTDAGSYKKSKYNIQNILFREISPIMLSLPLNDHLPCSLYTSNLGGAVATSCHLPGQ